MYTGIRKPVMEYTLSMIVGVLGVAVAVALYASQVMA